MIVCLNSTKKSRWPGPAKYTEQPLGRYILKYFKIVSDPMIQRFFVYLTVAGQFCGPLRGTARLL